MASTAVRHRPHVGADSGLTALPAWATRRERFAALERPFLLVGLVLVTGHFLDLAFSGPDTTLLGVVAIVALPIAVAALQPRVARLTRFALAVPTGLLFTVAGGLAHVLDLFTSGPRWSDVTGVAFAAGGVLLIAAGCAALAAPRRAPRRRSPWWRAAHVVGWLLGAFVIGQFVVLSLVAAVVTTHAMRLPITHDGLAVRHVTVSIPAANGDRLAAWYVPSRNGAAVLMVHGSGSNRSHVAGQAELVARHGYGVLSVDLPGHGESDGHANLLGANAQPAIAAAIDWLARQHGVQTARIAGFGMSLGAEVLLEAAARDVRLHAVISDGAERAADDRELKVDSGLARMASAVGQQAVRAVSGMRQAPPLLGLIGRIAPRRVLLIAAGGRPNEIRVNRTYREAAGPTAQLWTVPEAGHTRGIDARPVEYERRVIAFLDDALG